MGQESASELTRRGFIVLAASAFGAFFVKPGLAEALTADKSYLVSVQTIGYGFFWEKEEDQDFDWEGEPDCADEVDEAEIQREALGPGSILYFWQDPDIPKDEAWLDVVSESGDKLCDIPWCGAPDEIAAVKSIVDKINEGHEVWAEVTEAGHSTIDAGDDYARIHRVEFDVYYR